MTRYQGENHTVHFLLLKADVRYDVRCVVTCRVNRLREKIYSPSHSSSPTTTTTSSAPGRRNPFQPRFPAFLSCSPSREVEQSRRRENKGTRRRRRRQQQRRRRPLIIVKSPRQSRSRVSSRAGGARARKRSYGRSSTVNRDK